MPESKDQYYILRFTLMSGRSWVKACKAHLLRLWSWESILYFMASELKQDFPRGSAELIF
eukprot:2294520-Amphidinium_carterae.1